VNTTSDKGDALLALLKATVTMRRKRISSYGAGDKLLWLADIPNERAECRSPFLTELWTACADESKKPKSDTNFCWPSGYCNGATRWHGGQTSLAHGSG